MPEHQKAQKKSQKIQSIQDKRKICRRNSIAAEEEMRKLQEEIRQKEERHLFLSNKIDKNKMQKAEMVAELQRLQAGEERRGSNASQTGDCCKLAALCVLQWVQTRLMPWPMLCSKGSKKVEQLRSRCQEEMKEEGIVKMNKSKAEPVSNWRCPRQAGSIKMHQRVVWSLIFLVYGVCLVKAEVQEEQASKGIERGDHPDHQDELLWMKKTMTMWEDWCLKQKRKKNRERPERPG